MNEFQNRCHVPIARLKSAKLPSETFRPIRYCLLHSVWRPCSVSECAVKYGQACARMHLAACLAVSPYAFARHPILRKARRHPATSQPVAIDEDRPVNWKSLVPNIYHDQRAIWTFPASLLTAKIGNPPLRSCRPGSAGGA